MPFVELVLMALLATAERPRWLLYPFLCGIYTLRGYFIYHVQIPQAVAPDGYRPTPPEHAGFLERGIRPRV
jgi:hypothetical protein